jgi:hypothetical protein
MAELHPFTADKLRSVLYIIAHMGPLRDPHPIELQHMRIRRYMDLLREYKSENHSYNEDEDIFVEFNLYPPKQYPALMLGEAIANHRYEAVFVDIARPIDSSRLSEREHSLLQIWNILKSLPTRLIDVSDDPDNLLATRLAKSFRDDARVLCGSTPKGP